MRRVHGRHGESPEVRAAGAKLSGFSGWLDHGKMREFRQTPTCYADSACSTVVQTREDWEITEQVSSMLACAAARKHKEPAN
jgi:hypothetical protein